MKYIRTKDGRIFEIIESDDETGTFVITNHKETCTLSYHDESIFEQAKIIEQLCDEFVLLNPCEDNYPMLLTGLFPDVKHNLFHISYAGKDTLNYEDFCFPSELPLDKADVYGSIWTKGEHGDPILKPVAKLNYKGVLELL